MPRIRIGDRANQELDDVVEKFDDETKKGIATEAIIEYCEDIKERYDES